MVKTDRLVASPNTGKPHHKNRCVDDKRKDEEATFLWRPIFSSLCEHICLENHVSQHSGPCFCLFLYICVCLLSACMRFGERERDWRECKREREIGDRMGDDGLDLITGLEWLEGFVVPHFLNRTFLSAGWGRIHNSRQASARGTEC